MESPNCGLPTKIIKSFGLIVRADFSIIIDVYKQVCLHSYMTKQKANLIEWLETGLVFQLTAF